MFLGKNNSAYIITAIKVIKLRDIYYFKIDEIDESKPYLFRSRNIYVLFIKVNFILSFNNSNKTNDVN